MTIKFSARKKDKLRKLLTNQGNDIFLIVFQFQYHKTHFPSLLSTFVFFYCFIRQGLLDMTILLMRFGADPTLQDSEGKFLGVSSYYATGLFLYTLKTSEYQRFFGNFKAYRKRPKAWNGFIRYDHRFSDNFRGMYVNQSTLFCLKLQAEFSNDLCIQWQRE